MKNFLRQKRTTRQSRYGAMTSFPSSAHAAPGQLSFARARLYLGITGVGMAVTGAAALLIFDVPAAGFGRYAERSVLDSLVALGAFFAFVNLLFFCTDMLGGAWVVRRRQPVTQWLQGWSRGVAVQWGVWMLMAGSLMAATRAFGVAGGVAVFIAGQLLLALARGRMAQLVAALPVCPTPSVIGEAGARAGIASNALRVVDATDEAFVGGWSSLRPRVLYVPKHWGSLPAAALDAQLVRRQLVAESGAHTRGVVGAVLWNTLGFLVVLALSGASPATATGIITLAAGLTLWAFVGVLVLPTLSRRAVYAVDAAAVERTDAASVKDAIERLDRWQDDEPSRTPLVESIFHPVPARAQRIARLGAAHNDAARAGASGRAITMMHLHHMARHALWLGWGAMTPISRVVHCNVGRPQLWVMLPGD